MTKPLADRIALVTGASRGIGHATALALARAGAHVVAVARTVGGLEELDDAIRADGGTATLFPSTSRTSTASTGSPPRSTSATGGSTCWSAMPACSDSLSPLAHVEPKDWDEAHRGQRHRQLAADPRAGPAAARSDAGRAVFVTSGVASTARAYWGTVCGVQGGARRLARTYAAETVDHHVRVNLFAPGATRTRMRASAMPGEDPCR